MKCPQCSRWIQVGLAVLASNLPNAINAATLEDYTDGATSVGPSQGITLPDAVKDTTDESVSDITPVENKIKPEQPAIPTFTNLQPADDSHEQSGDLAEANEVENFYESSESLSEELALPEERSLETVTIAAAGIPQGFTEPNFIQDITVESTADILSVENKIELEQPAASALTDLQSVDSSALPLAEENKVDDFQENSSPLFEEVDLSEEPSPRSVEVSNALPTEALPMTRVISPGEIPEDMPDHIVSSNEEVLIAQVIPDDTLGAESSVVVPNEVIHGAPADVIEAGATRGSNLFHSFESFSIDSGQRVYFAEPVGVENILSRVTGKTVSEIDGLLGVNGTANLFFLNPNGITFGPNAELDISGSFTASTADSVDFSDGGVYSAVPPQEGQVLTMSVPLGVQFNQQPQGDIANDGELTVGVGQSLSLSGNSVVNGGVLTASEGTIEILGNQVGLVEQATIDVSGSQGGQVLIVAEDVELPSGLIDISGTVKGGELEVYANNDLNLGVTVDATGGGYALFDPTTFTVGTNEANTIVATLAGGNATISASNTINVNAAIDSQSQTNSNTLTLDDENADNNLVINLNAPILLGTNQTLIGNGSTVNVNVTDSGIVQNGADVAVAGGTVNLAAGTYREGQQVILNRDVTLNGAGANNTILNGNNTHRVLEVNAGITSNINDLTIENGSGGGIRNSNGILIITNSTISGNNGGGISNNGYFSLTNSIISGNTSTGFGGGISSDGAFNIANSTISGNTANDGGGVYDYNTLSIDSVIINSTISGNLATTDGGGISHGGGNLEITNSTISGNTANNNGGGIDNKVNTIILRNSTVSGNTASYSGGGIDNSNDGILNITSSTISGNTATNSGGGINSTNYSYYAVDINSSIISGNNAPTGANLNVSNTSSFSSNSNLFGHSSNSGVSGATPSANDIVPTVPLNQILETTLVNNGGLTQTLALLPGSPAVNAAGIGATTTDQRGFPAAGIRDIGAFEFLSSLLVDTLVDETDSDLSTGDISLREAIQFIQPGGTIRFSPVLNNGIITLGLGQLTVDRDLIIDGLGPDSLTVSGNNASRVFNIQGTGTNITLSNLRIANGRDDFGGGIRVANGSRLTLSDSQLENNLATIAGAGLYSEGVVIVSDSRLDNIETALPGTTTLLGTITTSGNQIYHTGITAPSNLTLQGRNIVFFENNTIAGDLNIEVTGTILQNNGSLNVDGTTKISTSLPNSGDVFISSTGDLIFSNDVEVGGDLTIVTQPDTSSVFLSGSSQVAGDLLVNGSPQNITETTIFEDPEKPGSYIVGTIGMVDIVEIVEIIGSPGVITGDLVLTTSPDSEGFVTDFSGIPVISLNQPENQFNGEITVVTELPPTGATPASIIQSDSLRIGGHVTLDAQSTGSIYLDLSNNQFGPLSLTGDNVFIRENSTAILDSATVNGNLTVAARDINITSPLSVAGNLSLEPYEDEQSITIGADGPPDSFTIDQRDINNINLSSLDGVTAIGSPSGSGSLTWMLVPDERPPTVQPPPPNEESPDVQSPSPIEKEPSNDDSLVDQLSTGDRPSIALQPSNDNGTLAVSQINNDELSAIQRINDDEEPLVIQSPNENQSTNTVPTSVNTSVDRRVADREIKITPDPFDSPLTLRVPSGNIHIISNNRPVEDPGDVTLFLKDVTLEAADISLDTLGSVALENTQLLGTQSSGSSITIDTGLSPGEFEKLVLIGPGQILAPFGFVTIFANVIDASRADNFDIIAGEVTINSTLNQILDNIARRNDETPGNDIISTGFLQNTSGVDPSEGLTELPTNLIDASSRIARGCRTDDIAGDSGNPTGDFVITGRGGQPLNPGNSIDDATTLDDLGPVDAQIDLSVPTTRILEPIANKPEVVEDAQKAVMTESGDILLVANGSWHSSVSCSALR